MLNGVTVYNTTAARGIFSVLQKDSSIVNLAADEASLAKIEKAIGTIDGSNYNVSVHMKYSLTGRKRKLNAAGEVKPVWMKLRSGK